MILPEVEQLYFISMFHLLCQIKVLVVVEKQTICDQSMNASKINLCNLVSSSTPPRCVFVVRT